MMQLCSGYDLRGSAIIWRKSGEMKPFVSLVCMDVAVGCHLLVFH
jgi:hypothetical protein